MRNPFWKKSLLLLIITLFTFTLVQPYRVNAALRIYQKSRDTQYVEGVRHIKIAAEIDFNGTISEQVINYAGINIKNNPHIKVVVADNYKVNGFGMSTVPQQIWNIHQKFPNVQVIAGVNGDFYNMSNGIPVSPYVRNYEVIFQGTTWARTLVGFKDNGDVVFGKPTFSGYEVMVFDQDGSLKLNPIKVNAFNRLPANDNEVTAFFTEHASEINSGAQKLIVHGLDIKSDGSGSRYFSKGTFGSITNEVISVQENQFILMGSKLFAEGFIESTDTIVVQQRMSGIFEGVRDAIGGWEILVKNGVPETTFTQGASYQFRAPRTAVGIKNDGTVFFVTVDGRNMPLGMDGVTAYEMAEIMAYFEADYAINLDGGGSTTMAILNGEDYDIVNTPSDGNLRSNANGVFFVKGDLPQTLPPIPYPDNREILNTPSNLFIQNSGVLTFNAVDHATRYEVWINGTTKIDTTTNSVTVNLPIGTYDIQVRAYGNHDTHKQSLYSEALTFTVYSNDMLNFIDFIRAYTQTQHNNNQSN